MHLRTNQNHHHSSMSSENHVALVRKFGLFGVGRMGRVHGELLQAANQHIVALGDESASCAHEAKRVLSLDDAVPVFDSATAMAAECAKLGIDAVFIASHTRSHGRDAAPFVAAGVRVYVEKPLTAKLAEAFDFVERFGPSRTLMQIGLQRRFDAALVYAKSLIDARRIGDVREIRSVLRDQYIPPATYVSPGLIVDMGIHVADEVVWLIGEFPAKIWAHRLEAKGYDSSAAQALQEGGNTAFVGFTTASGTIGRLDLSRTHSSGYNNETYIIGTHGTIHVGRFAGYPGPIHVELWLPDGKQDTAASRTFPMAQLAKGQHYAEYLPRFKDAFVAAHASFRAKLADKNEPFLVSHIDVLDAQVFVEAATLSADRGGVTIEIQRSDSIADYRATCQKLGLLN
jgi:myo-inositol 2-dehydrogenase/D-chiro-inositol 1-dehydrogenase